MTIRWYFDFISPFSYLHWQKVKASFDMQGGEVTPVPIVFGAVLAACGQKGPAEIPGKREFTYRHVLWQAREEGVALRFPPAHPFNPLAALRLCVAAGSTVQAREEGVTLRFPPAHPFNPLAALRLCVAAGSTVQAVDALFDWIWKDGNAGDSFESLAAVAAALGIDAATAQDDAAKTQLRANTEAAIAAGVYGVPTLAFDGQLFWGNDAHAFALAALRHPEVLADPEMQRVGSLPVGVQRR